MNKFMNLVFGCFLTSIGVILLGHAEIVTGGTAGLALSFSLVLNLPFYLLFFLINIPFYIFSVLRMGWSFTISTILSVSMLSFMTFLGSWLPELTLNPIAAGLIGSMVIGFGLSTLFLNGSSLGGANILALYFQKKFNWDPGKVNFIFDFLVVLSGFYYLGLLNGLYSIVSIAIYSSIISYFKNQIKERNVQKESKGLTLSAN
ncbi:YitT family protein [Halalkalibacter alkalisediminis]|uniref:YitT family protein n=1 Tax=Halalkalibacter alkalisediminis TaxID=935616 RepID=A0ABV6NIR5_9BACI|nr:YitT family protein [Halalkalibacter alkalisediminis]